MNNTADVLATIEKFSADDKDAVLCELLREKWIREGRGESLLIKTRQRPFGGIYFPVLDPPSVSTPPQWTDQELADIRHAASHLEDSFTTDEAIAYLHREVDRKRGGSPPISVRSINRKV